MNAAISAGLLAGASASQKPVPASLHERYTPVETEALALFPQVVDLVAAILGNRTSWSNEQSIEESIFLALSGRKPSAAEADLIRAVFVSCVDHTPATPSSLAAITSYSGGNSLKTALAAGITSMGEAHAGAGEGTARILIDFLARMREAEAEGRVFEADGVRVADIKELAVYVVNKITGAFGDAKGRIPGFGHRYYGLYGRDPRATTLLAIVDELGLAGDYCTLAREIETVLRKKKSSALCFNVDGVIGALLCDLKLAPETGKAFFIIPRTAGLLGQLLEQAPGSFFRLQNESVIYIGPGVRE